MKRLLACAALAFATAAHADEPQFAWHAPLAIDGTHAFYRVELPPNVYEGVVRSDLADVRVRNADGEPVPFAFVPVQAADRERAPAIELPLFPLYVDRDAGDLGDLAITMRRDAGGTRIDLATREGRAVTGQRLAGYLIDAGERHAPLAALTLVPAPSAANVDVRVRIEASDDLATWRSLVGAAPLLSLEFRDRHLVRERIELPAVDARYLRVAFVPAARGVEIAAARGEAAPHVVEPERQWRKAPGTADARRPGEYGFDVGGYFPVDRVTLELPDLNAVAPAVVSAARPTASPRGDPDDAWRQVATSVFYRLRQGDGETANAPVSVPTTAARRWKVRIDPSAGSLGSNAPSLSVGYVPRTIVFAARGNPPFELLWGSAKAGAVALPIATLVPGFDARTTPATFGVASVGALPVAPALDALREPVDLKRRLLWATLALATVVLAWMALALVRQMRAAPPSGDRETGPPV